MTHTVLLLQTGASKNTRTYFDYESTPEMVEGVCRLYEQGVRLAQPGQTHIEYDVADLYRFVDQLPDCGVLTYDTEARMYRPHNKQWLKEQCYRHLKAKAK
ncbi:hypothetical protein CDCA_CDCA14G3851 [Cyanidium caldarium]|uniref:Enhancer of rudimentary homolog n=1 Tax=Cyanidium caldarium TaxID=2771 RepID=A0AAV9J0A5_CYACA|nr:hypothetical protein CDCA_CDCA14G3851 [Cyanidium caldarium]